MSPELYRILVDALPAWIVAGSFVLLVYFVRGILFELRAPRLALATAPATVAATVALSEPRFEPDTFSKRVKRGFVHATIREYESIGYRRVQISDAGADYVIVVMDRNGRSRSTGQGNR